MKTPLGVVLVCIPLWVVAQTLGFEPPFLLDIFKCMGKEVYTPKSYQVIRVNNTGNEDMTGEKEASKKEGQGHHFYQIALEILKYLKNAKEKEEAYQVLAKAAEMGHQKALENLAADMLFGYNRPPDVKVALSLYEILAKEGSHRSQTALGFMYSYGIGVEHNQAKALVYYTFASIGGSLVSQMIMGYRYWLGINVPSNCETALIYYREVANIIAKKLENYEDIPVEKVRLMERSGNLSLNTEFLDWDVHQYYKYLAERGNTNIQVYLGHLHLLGRKGLEKDHNKAFYYFLKAANAGSPNGMAFLGKMYLEGSAAVTQSNTAAFKYFKMAADKGNSIGLWGLGFLSFHGRGVPLNYTEAFTYFQKAAEKGFANAQFQLGVMYHTGSGVTKDFKLAFRYFYLASQNGQPLAVYYMAQMYATGTGVFRSCQNAVELYRTVCEQGRWSEKFLTAYLAYQAGNIDSSLVQYAFLAEMGYEVAQSNSAYIMESGNAAARIKMGDYHFYGFGTTRDYITAVVHYNLAANQQSAQAMFNLAYMYEHGLGIPKDIHLARRWYDLAAETNADAFIPVLLACIRLEAMRVLTDLQVGLIGIWKLPALDSIRLYWDIFIMIFTVVLLLLLINNRQN